MSYEGQIMPKNVARKKRQSMIGLLQEFGLDLSALSRARPIYRHLVELLERAMARGHLVAGQRLPPERDLASALDVSRTTVVSAYRELESKGLVRGYVGRGTFVSAKPDAASAPFAWRGKISAAALQSTDSTLRDLVRDAADPALISVAAGEPALGRFPTAAFQEAVQDILARGAMIAWRHGPTEGLQPFRAAVAARFGGQPENVLVIAGAQQGLDLLTRCLVDPGDAVIIDRPGYLGAIRTFRNVGARLIGWDIARAEVDELEELLLRYRPKLIYTNPTFQNPTGVTLPLRVRRDMLDLAERYRVPIVEDDTYRELGMGAAPPPSLYELDDQHALVIHLNSFSKMLAPGLRLGWITAAQPIVDQLALIKQQADPHTQNLTQLVVAALIENGTFDRHLAVLRGEHRRRRDAFAKAFQQYLSPGAVRFATPEGGLYLWCRLGGGVRARVVLQQAARDSIVFVPGDVFYVDRGGNHEFRICYSSQGVEKAPHVAKCIARSIATAREQGDSESPLVRIV